MADESGGDRKSKAASPVLIEEPLALARREAENGLKQFDQVRAIIEEHRDTKRPFKLRPSLILGLQRTALDGITTYAGLTRPAGIEIGVASISRRVLIWFPNCWSRCAIT